MSRSTVHVSLCYTRNTRRPETFLPFEKTFIIIGIQEQDWTALPFFEEVHEAFNQLLNIRWEMLV